MENMDYNVPQHDTAYDLTGRKVRSRYNKLASRVPNAIGAPAPDAAFGYMAPVLTAMANTRRWAVVSRSENSVIIDQNYPLQLLQQTPIELLNAVKIAAQGSAVKATAQAVMPAGGADLTLNLGSVKSFGVMVRLTDSPLNFKFGTYTVQLLDGATVLGQVYITGAKLPVEIYLLGISNAGGQATAASVLNPQVKVFGSSAATAPSATVSSSTYVFAQTLNMRDIGSVTA